MILLIYKKTNLGEFILQDENFYNEVWWFRQKKIAISISTYIIINIKGSAIAIVFIVSIWGMFIRGISARKVYAVNIVDAIASFGRLRI